MRCLVLGLVLASSIAAADPLDKPAFTATPAELLAIAHPSDEADTTLRIDRDITFDDHSRITERWRWVITINTKAGADQNTAFTVDYFSFQNRTSFRARVISASGVTEIDPKVVTDTAHADVVTISAPLPRLAVGSVIEEELVITDREARTAAGNARTINLASVVSSRYTIIAPTALKVRTLLRGSTVKPTHTTANTLETWRYAFGPIAERSDEVAIPSDVALAPELVVSSIPSWNAIASALSARVDAQIAAGPIPRVAGNPRELLAWLQNAVKLDDVVVAVGPIAKSPAEVLKAGHADHFAFAVAYVALLRQAGISAELALIDVGPSFDVSSELPSLDDFDRAIVHTGDGWIDPVSDAMEIPMLATETCGRRALVLSGKTTALVETPALTPADTAVHESRTYELASEGDARVTHTTRATGIYAALARISRRDDPKGYEADALADAKERYHATKLESLTTTDPTKLDVPFDTTETLHTDRAQTKGYEAEVWLFPSDTVWNVGKVLTGGTTRTHELSWEVPHTYDIETRIIVPDGYAMPAISDRAHDVGTIKFTETQKITGNVLVVTQHLDTAKVRLTVKEVEATRAAIRTLFDERTHLVFPKIAYQLYDKGKWQDALAEMNRLIRAHPKVAMHHSDLGEMLAMMGLGEVGRREARMGVQLAPNDAAAHTALGWVLARDLFGRAYVSGADRAGARAELEKARALDPRRTDAIEELARMLEHDGPGASWTRSAADLKTVALLRGEIMRIGPTQRHAEELARALFLTGDYAGAETVTRAAKSSVVRDALLVAAVALRTDVATAISTADALGSGDVRKAALTTAASMAAWRRRYSEMRALYAELGMHKPNTPEAAIFAALAVHDRALDVKDPENAAIEAELSIVVGNTPRGYWDEKTGAEASAGVAQMFRSFPSALLVPLQVRADMMRSTVAQKVEGDKRGWRVELGASLGQAEVTYLADDRGTIKVIGGQTFIAGLGRHALRLLAKNDVAAATRLLDWAVADAKKDTFFRVMWGPNHGTDHATIELAAATLTGSTDPDHALPILDACAGAPQNLEFVCLLRISEINVRRDRVGDSVAKLEAYLQAHPGDSMASAILVTDLARLGRWKEAAALIPNIKPPVEVDVLRAQVAMSENDVPTAAKLLEEVAKSRPTAEHYNELAWYQLTTGSPGALASAEASVRIEKKYDNLHTKACIEAEVGDLRAAIDDGHAAIALESAAHDGDLYLLGRVYELVGLREDAIAVYKKMKPLTRQTFSVTTAELARRRLDALK